MRSPTNHARPLHLGTSRFKTGTGEWYQLPERSHSLVVERSPLKAVVRGQYPLGVRSGMRHIACTAYIILVSGYEVNTDWQTHNMAVWCNGYTLPCHGRVREFNSRHGRIDSNSVV